jgi:hypothetical protein
VAQAQELQVQQDLVVEVAAEEGEDLQVVPAVQE